MDTISHARARFPPQILHGVYCPHGPESLEGLLHAMMTTAGRYVPLTMVVPAAFSILVGHGVIKRRDVWCFVWVRHD